MLRRAGGRSRVLRIWLVLIASAPLWFGACRPGEAAKAPTPTPIPTINIFSTPTPSLSAADLAKLLGAEHLDSEAGFFMRYPRTWTLDTSQAEGFAAAFKAPTSDIDLTGRAYPTIAVGIDTPEGYVGGQGRLFLDNTLENGKDLLAKTLADFKLLSLYVQRLPTGDAAAFEYTYSTQTAGLLHSVQLVIPGRSRVFLLTLTSLESTWNFHRQTFLAAAATFTVLAGK